MSYYCQCVTLIIIPVFLLRFLVFILFLWLTIPTPCLWYLRIFTFKKKTQFLVFETSYSMFYCFVTLINNVMFSAYPFCISSVSFVFCFSFIFSSTFQNFNRKIFLFFFKSGSLFLQLFSFRKIPSAVLFWYFSFIFRSIIHILCGKYIYRKKVC